jgi:aminoglycoside phosphotransferase (APT) family kinase protein
VTPDDASTEPSARGLAKLAAALGVGVTITGTEKLLGGLATTVHAVNFSVSGRQRRVVIKRFPPASAPPENEWNALEFAARFSLPSPAPLLFDTGGWFGVPCIATEFLHGAPDLRPDVPSVWVAELARALATIHKTPITGVAGWLHRPAIWQRWDPDTLPAAQRSAAIADAIEALRDREWKTTFCHGDFHPGNVLFDNKAVTGVVDWASARAAPALSDVGRARAALSICPGDRLPDDFATTYEILSGTSLDGLAYWDVLSGSITATNAHRLTQLYQSFGISLTAEEIHKRATEFVDRALQHL